jgi:hypothetical protein
MKKPQKQYEPYKQSGSIIYHAFALARKGCKEDEIRRLVMKGGGDPVRTLRRLKSGLNRGYQWDIDEVNGWLKIFNVRPISTQNGQTTHKPTPKG